jgi:hypothetical protein
VFFLGYMIIRPLMRLFAGKARSQRALEIENAVLRHQLGVLREAEVPALRPGVARCSESATASATVESFVCRHAADAPALAP